MTLTLEEARNQLNKVIEEAGVEITSNINSKINEQLTQKVKVLGKKEKRHEMMCS